MEKLRSYLGLFLNHPHRSAETAEARLKRVLANDRALTRRAIEPIPVVYGPNRASSMYTGALHTWEEMGHANDVPVPPMAPEMPPVLRQSTRDQVYLLRRSLHAGQVFDSAGSVVILGNVNPAAEVIAEKDIIVFGKLRGVAHAGRSGDEACVVAALLLSPTQLRIGQQIADVTYGQHQPAPRAEVARIQEGQIRIEAWSPLLDWQQPSPERINPA